MKALWKSIISLTLVMILTFTACSSVIFIMGKAISQMDTPIAKIPNDTYVPYNERHIGIPSSISDDLDVEVYESEDAYLFAKNSSSISDTLQVKTEAVSITIKVLDKLTSKPIANAITRLNGVPRYTDRNGEVKVTLSNLIYELYIVKDMGSEESYNPHMEFIYLEDFEANAIKTVYLKRPSDDISFEYAMFDNSGNLGNVLVQDSYVTLHDEYNYADLNIKTNVVADEYRLYCDSKLVIAQTTGHFAYLELEEFCQVGSKLSIQAVYQGIESKITELNIFLMKQVEQKDICDPDKINIDLNIDGDETNRSSDKPGFFGEFTLDLQDLMKNLFSIFDERNSMALNFSIDPRTGNIKALIGYELEIKSEEKEKLQEELRKLKKNEETKAERDKIKKEIKKIENRDLKKFGNTYNDIKKTLKKKQEGDKKASQRKTLDLIKRIKDIKPRIKQTGAPHFSKAPEFKLNVEVVGAFEFNIVNKQFLDMSLMVMCEGKVQFNGQFVVVYVPCFWKIDIGFDAEFKITLLTREDEKALLKLEDLLNLTVEVYAKGEIGVGFCDLLSVSGYIRLGLKMDWTIIASDVDLYGTLMAGVKLKALFWDFNWDIYDKEWKIVGNQSYEQSARRISMLTENQLSTNMYEASKPTLTNYKDKLLLTWVEYSSEKDLYNNTMLMYSVLDNGFWTEPQAVLDDGFADFDYDIYNDNDEALYITWQSASKELNASSDLLDMSRATEIYFAQFDEAKQTFSNIERLTNDIDMDAQPYFAKKEKSEDPLTVLWRKNSENNILGFSGQNYFVQSTFKDGTWIESKQVALFNTPVSNGVSAYKNGILNTAFIVDVDGNLMTNDREVVLAKDGTLLNLTNNPSEYSYPTYIRNKSGYVLSFKDKNELKLHYDGFDEFETSPAEINCLDAVKIVQDDINHRKILYYTKLVGDVKQLYCSVYDEETGTWSNGVCLTDEKYNVLEPSIAITKTGSLGMSYYLYDELTETMSLCYVEKELNFSIKIENAYMDDIVKTGVEFGIRFEVFNSGDLPITELVAEIGKRSYNIKMNKPLLPNERDYYQMYYNVENTDTKELEIIVNAKYGGAIVSQDRYTLSINYVDYGLQVEKEIIDGKQVFSITGCCLSERSGKTTLVIYREGKEVYRSLIDINGEINIQYSFEELAINDQLKFELITADNDFDLTNNEVYIYSTLNEVKPIDNTQWNDYKQSLEIAKGVAIWG